VSAAAQLLLEQLHLLRFHDIHFTSAERDKLTVSADRTIHEWFLLDCESKIIGGAIAEHAKIAKI
jgi:hypothetical protein